MYYIEIRAGVRRSGPPRLVSLEEAGVHRGFRSTFAYDEDTATIIREVGGTSNLRGRPVYCDVLYMDFDDHDPVAFLEWLRGSGLAYEVYDSGNRSVHVHIPVVPVFGSWVPAAVKRWTKIHAPTADTSFLHPAGVYRLPGTFHPKNPGKCKQLVESLPGDRLVLVEPPEREMRSIEASGSREDFFLLLLEHREPGGRQPFMWRLAITAAQAGMDLQETLENMLWWNAKQSQPHPEHIVERQCLSAYNQLTRRTHG